MTQLDRFTRRPENRPVTSRLGNPFSCTLRLPALSVLLATSAFMATPVLAQNLEQSVSKPREVDSRIEKIVRVTSDESFNSIAVKEFGSIGLGRLLAEYNQLAVHDKLAVGSEVIIPTHLEPKKNFAIVAFTKGETRLKVAGSLFTTRPLEADAKIYSTDVIVTGKDGFVSLQLSNGSTLNVQPSSEISLRTLQCLPQDAECEVNIDSSAGSVAADVEKRSDQQNRFLISTPYASAAVRGTVLDFGASADQMLVGVTEGEVEISAGSGSTSLPIGFGVVAGTSGLTGDPVPLLKAPVFYQVPQRFSSEDVLAWRASLGAENYQLSFTSDAAGQQEIYRQSVSAEAEQTVRHSINPLPPGEVFAMLRPVDEFGLKGFRGIQALNVVELDDQLPKPQLSFDEVDEQDSVFVFPQAETAGLVHEVQFSETPDFTELLSVDIPQNGGTQHGREGQKVYYARARVLADDNVVGGYGQVLEITEAD